MNYSYRNIGERAEHVTIDSTLPHIQDPATMRQASPTRDSAPSSLPLRSIQELNETPAAKSDVSGNMRELGTPDVEPGEQHLQISHPRPYTIRSMTHPEAPAFPLPERPQHSRTPSPSSGFRSQQRSHSASNFLSAPSMRRAHSSPSYLGTIPAARSSSPLRSPARTHSPIKPVPEDRERLPYSPVNFLDITSISEDAELDLTPRSGGAERAPGLPPASANNTFPRQLRRRPTSPLHHVSSVAPPAFGTSSSSSTTSSQSSPNLSATRFNEAFPNELHYTRSFSSSSVPSTPTSMRSRSPSISSLETIPDTPDAEEAATEEDKLDRLRRGDDSTSGGTRRNSHDDPRGRSFGGSVGLGFGLRSDKKKRWSVCGAEKRGDLDLETIWED